MATEKVGRSSLCIPPPSESGPPPSTPLDMEKSLQKGPKPLGPPGGPPSPPGGWLVTRMSKQQEILFNIMVAMLQLIPQSTLTTVFPVSKAIAADFEIHNPSILPWLVAAYAVSFSTCILLGGRLGDLFGHKTMVIIGYSWLSFWSVVAGLSPYAGYELFFVARGFQGIGASLMVPNGLALLGRTYPPGSKQKIFAFTLFGLCAPVGAYLGMIFGALFTTYGSWWWSFYTLAIVSFFLAIASTVILKSPPPTPKQMLPVREKLRDMDWLGAVTGVGGLICVQVSLVSAPASGWSTQYIFMLLIIGLLLIAFFVVTELKVAEQPLVPFKMLKADVGFVLGAVACGWATFGIWTWFLWKYLLDIKQDAPLEAALHVLPIVPVALVASVLTAWMMRKCQPSWTLFWALVAFTFGPLLLALDSNIDKTTYWSWTFASLVVMPFGMDMSFPAATLIMSNYFPPHMQGVAASLIATVVNYSISIGLGLASTVEVQVSKHNKDQLTGIRGGWFTGVGLGGLGILISVAFVLRSIYHPKPTMSQGPPPGPPDPGSAMQLTPTERKLSRPNTVSSLATTMVPETPRLQSPTKGADFPPFKAVSFDTITNSPAPPSRAYPHHASRNADFPISKVPSLKEFHTARAKSRQKPFHSIKLLRKSSLGAATSHARSESQVELYTQAPDPPSTPTRPRPTELDRVHRAYNHNHIRFDSDDSIDWEMLPRRDDGRTHEFGNGYAYGSGSSSGQRDPDGFEYYAKPVVPHGHFI